jgi:hypothetical protein
MSEHPVKPVHTGAKQQDQLETTPSLYKMNFLIISKLSHTDVWIALIWFLASAELNLALIVSCSH